MNEVKHTRGPWAVNEDGFKVESAEEHGWVNDGWVICVTEGPDKEANARLIAAAPEMLEALEKVDGHLSILMGNIHGSAKVDLRWEGMEEVVSGWRDELKAVLAKAKGLTP